MKNLLVLFVDNDDSMFDSCNETAIEWNKANKNSLYHLEIIRAENIEKANQLLDRYKFHAAITDLRLPIKNEEESPVNGNNLALTTMHERGLPIAIVSGYIKDLKSELADLRHVGSFTKDDGYGPAFDWLASNFEMIQTLNKAKSKIEKISSEVFAKRIWPHWSRISHLLNEDPEKLSTIVGRQYATQISELLSVDIEKSVNWHPIEFFIIPPLVSDRVQTGDVFKFENDDIYTVLTPKCDLANCNVKNVILAKCNIGHSNWESAISILRNKDSGKDKRKSSSKKLDNLVNQNFSKTKHFIPPLPGETDPLLVDFTELTTMPMVEINNKLEQRLCSIANPFLENLVQRFGAYVSRTGQPDMDLAYLI